MAGLFVDFDATSLRTGVSVLSYDNYTTVRTSWYSVLCMAGKDFFQHTLSLLP
jgi:hypothetical protein